MVKLFSKQIYIAERRFKTILLDSDEDFLES